MQNLTINADRLWDTLMETARFGATEKGGVCRLTLTEADKAVRDWFRAAAEAIGCTVTVDEVGSQYALYPGKHPDRPPVAMGSHLDTQPTGGKFDGILGVLAGLEVLRTLHDTGFEPDTPLMLVNWTNEEGARFQSVMMGSAVYAGFLSTAAAYAVTDRDGTRFGEALAAIGYRGEAVAGSQPFSAFFELHIEQGPILEAENKTIGVVTNVQGIRWFHVLIKGLENHAGTTPMHLRRDGLVGAAKLTLAVNELACGYGGRAVGTVGQIRITPGSPNVIPGDVFFSIDFRSPDPEITKDFDARFRARAEQVAAEHGLEIEVKAISDIPPIPFDTGCIEAVRSGAERLGYAYREMISGAGHDSCHVAAKAPTAMIFVPCKDGLSHNELEHAEKEHCAAGANVLLQAVLTKATDT